MTSNLSIWVAVGLIAVSGAACTTNVPAQAQHEDRVTIPPDSTHITGKIDPRPVPTSEAKVVAKNPYRNAYAWGCKIVVRYIDVPDYETPISKTDCHDIVTEFVGIRELKRRFGSQIDSEVEYLITHSGNDKFLLASTPTQTILYPVNQNGDITEQNLKR